MYIGTHYNSYYNSLFGDRGSVYSNFAKAKATNSYLSTANSSSSIFNNSSLKYVQDLKGSSASLGSVLKALAGRHTFRKKCMSSSNNAVLKLKSDKAGSLGDRTLSVKIDQVAAGQKNQGKNLTATEKSAANGYQQFSVSSNGRTYQFSINVGAGDTNKDVQQKMADAINERSIGITASVSTDSSTGTSAIKLETQSTGDTEKSKFTIQDVYGSVVEQTGAAQVEQQAQDAIYRVNGGEEQRSQSNTVDLGSGVTATLLKASDEEVVVSETVDGQYALSQVEEFISSYNKLYGTAYNKTDDNKANKLFTQLVNASRTYTSSLAKIGIGFDSQGYMQADSEKLAKAMEDGSLERFFSGSANFGYPSQLSRIASNVSNNTSQYVSKSTLGADLTDSYYNFNYNSYSNSNFLSTYQSFLSKNNTFNSGLLFDLML